MYILVSNVQMLVCAELCMAGAVILKEQTEIHRMRRVICVGLPVYSAPMISALKLRFLAVSRPTYNTIAMSSEGMTSGSGFGVGPR